MTKVLIKHLYEVFIVSCHHIIDESVNILLAITKLFGKTPSLPHESKGIASWASEIDDDFSRDGLFSNHDMVFYWSSLPTRTISISENLILSLVRVRNGE